MAIHSFHELFEFLREKARRAYLALKHNHPDETVCALAIDTDDDTVAFGVWGITEEQFSTLLAEHDRKYPPTGFIERTCREAGMRISPHEWPPIDYSEIPDRNTNEDSSAEWPTATMSFMNEWTSVPGNSFKSFRKHAFRAMADALRSLDKEGLFGRGQCRDKIVLFLSISDSEDDWYLQIESSQKLNSRNASRRLLSSISFAVRLVLLMPYYIRYFKKGELIADHSLQDR